MIKSAGFHPKFPLILSKNHLCIPASENQQLPKPHPKQGIQGAKPKVWRQIGIKPYKKNGLSVKHLPSSAWQI